MSEIDQNPEDDEVERIMARLRELYRHPSGDIEIWAQDGSPLGHAAYDLYIQGCADCQRTWIAAVLDASKHRSDYE